MYGFFLQSVAEKNKKSPDTFRENPEYTDRDKIIPTLLIIKGNVYVERVRQIRKFLRIYGLERDILVEARKWKNNILKREIFI